MMCNKQHQLMSVALNTSLSELLQMVPSFYHKRGSVIKLTSNINSFYKRVLIMADICMKM